jgi:ankyrin repeat protein
MISAWAGEAEIAGALLEAGADPNAKDIKGRTALGWAERKGHTDIVQILKEAGAGK